jgi:hypothetical protein
MKKDLRRYSSQTTIRLILGGVGIFLIIGGGLIYFVYGPAAALSGILCFTVGLIPVILLILVFGGMDWIIKRANRD